MTLQSCIHSRSLMLAVLVSLLAFVNAADVAFAFPSDAIVPADALNPNVAASLYSAYVNTIKAQDNALAASSSAALASMASVQSNVANSLSFARVTQTSSPTAVNPFSGAGITNTFFKTATLTSSSQASMADITGIASGIASATSTPDSSSSHDLAIGLGVGLSLGLLLLVISAGLLLVRRSRRKQQQEFADRTKNLAQRMAETHV